MKSHVPAGRAMTDAGGPSDRGRAGRYVLQPAGYRAFVPAPLPPRPPVRMTGVVQARLSAADRALGRLDGTVHTLPEADLFVLMYVRKEAVLSSQTRARRALSATCSPPRRAFRRRAASATRGKSSTTWRR